MTHRTPALEVVGLSKHYGGLHAMRPIDLTLGDGDRLSVIGTNGAGKSTLFNCIAGTVRASTGRVSFFGTDVTRTSAAHRAGMGIARTFQTSRLFDNMTVAQNVYVALGGRRFPGGSLRPVGGDAPRWDEASKLLARVGLEKVHDAVVGDISHGEQRQLELAMAFALEPKILMLDEPAAGFSPAERARLVTILRELPREVSLILIEHDMDIALAVADRVIVMHDGSKILEGTPDEIRRSERVREIYLGGAIDDVA
ncbi:MAG: ABC transporter ATP-binding protein [Microbacterium sp.]|uniref:ABC transporter ATP-binding protein n=1 Tax=Microbacterium aquimaris TaxID=459816 RepID=UPI000C92D630|nr:ABC transporter ATP-binding protein [Microbacterium aquimaris]MAP62659.1 ABC transporter ATP-binding protein [Microbacterium sp.]MDZ8275151.1 ABC transporter ATP-binding protein [Microbacterium aquimaris]